VRRRLSMPPSTARTRTRRRASYSDITMSLGCTGCVWLPICGGLRDHSRRHNCLDDCCGELDGCDVVCVRNPDFTSRLREVEGFDFQLLPKGLMAPPRPPLPMIMPMIYHGNRRSGVLPVEYAALPLFRIISRADGTLLHADAAALRRAYRVGDRTQLYLSGVDRDAPLERFWGVSMSRRKATFATLREFGACGVSGPNYSTFRDVPRTDALHALKRIALVYEEMLLAGLPAALHLNGIFEEDYVRTAAWITAHRVIGDVAADFGTGQRGKPRGEQHARWIAALGAENGGRLHLIMRGGARWLPILLPAFAGITIIDTTSFFKTMHRQRFTPRGNEEMLWRPSPMELGAPVDRLLAHNIAAVAAYTIEKSWGASPGR
jgi:hypothetical protein